MSLLTPDAPSAVDARPPLPLPRNLTFDPDDWQVVARYWYPVAKSDEVTEGPLGATLLDVPLVVYRFEGEVVVADNLCTHRGMMLSLGEDQHDGKGIKCPYHGLRFGAAGRCTSIPAHPDDKIPERMHLRSYGAVERYGLVWACLAAAPGDEPVIPPVPHWDDPGFQQINCPWIDIEAFAGRQVEGFLDVAHFAFVHDKSFADSSNPVVPDYTPVVTADGFETEYWSSMGNVPVGVEADVPDDFLWLRHYRLHVPFTASLVVHFPDGGRLSMMNAASPVSARRTRLFDARCRNFDTDGPLQDVYDFNRQVFEEDRAMVENQKPENLPLDPKLEVHIPADRSSIAYRRALRDIGLSAFFSA
ncbi:MAG TPA: aromatic ring-hydroxylating dioxygenase subunit alpha [Luteimicrobium sp.]|nr:aromatic ring-hydroxylating dioxygenase subunit alpha [Luteimicrobium sp.]